MSAMFLTVKSAAERASVGVDTITAAIKSGRLKAKRTGRADKDGNPTGKHLISVKALEEWFEGLDDA